MFLNDACDVEFDRRYRTERPIPAGAISAKEVWTWGTGWLIIGAAVLFLAGVVTGLLGLALALCIVAYDVLHKRLSYSPLLMGGCRFLLYLTAAASGTAGIGFRSVWSGAALAAYVVAITYLARRESAGGMLSYWPLLLLASPIIVAVSLQGSGEGPLLLGLIFSLWAIRSLRHSLWSRECNIGRTVAGLLAGIVFVDWLAAAGAPREFGFAFIGLFLLANFFQRFIPAT
jgi:4-hydroxybenzoate polyprenyltransferase